MTTRPRMAAITLAGALAAACGDPPRDPTTIAPRFHREGGGRGSVVVDPGGGHGSATTIQQGIVMAPPGGRVRILPGTYNERVVIDKGLTLEGMGDDDDGAGGPVIIEQLGPAPLGAREAVIQVVTTEPVQIRGITVHHVGLRGVNNFTETSPPFAVDLTIENASFLGEGTNSGGVSIVNNAAQSGGRAHLEIRNTSIHVNAIGIPLGGDVDALVEGNKVTAGAACLRLSPRGATVTVPAGAASNVDVVNNEFTDCGINGANGVNIQGDPGATTTGTVNIVGNTFRYTPGLAAPCHNTAILYRFYSGRIEHNSVINAVQGCADQTVTPAAAIRIGDAATTPSVRPADVIVRFNDIQGNAFAGLLVRANQTTALDARCNWWGSASGPSGTGRTGTGDAIVVETGAATPEVGPVATRPVAQRSHDGDHDNDDDDDRHARATCPLDFSLWSEPVNLGAPINSAGDEFGATLSPDGLSLYFNSDRTDLPGAQGGNDIWVSRRACADCPWGTPVNLGPLFNSPSNEGGVVFSNNGQVMFFNSNRPGGFGRGDIYMSGRTDLKDDFAWEAPVNLGPDVNTADAEGGPAYLEGAEREAAQLYFSRGVVQMQAQDIYMARLTRHGATLGPALPVSELNDPTVNDGGLTVRRDGRELIFWSNRGSPPDAVNGDLFVSSRPSVRDAWSTPDRLGAPINTAFDEINARLSRDGRALLITSRRPGGLGGTVFGFDVWMSTRTRIGQRER